MKSLARMAVGLLIMTMVGGIISGVEAKAEREASRFDKFRDSFGTPQIEPVQREKAMSMTGQRRIIVVDDGEAARVGELTTVEEFLAARFNSCVGSQVDSYFVGIQTPSYIASLGYAPETPFITRARQANIRAARQAGMEIFATLRMNDIHDAWAPKLSDPLKVERPDLLIGEQYWPDGYPHLLEGEEAQARGGYPKSALLRAFWSAFDYAQPEVRQYFLDFIADFCGKHDYDGLQLDYFRHPLFFKLGEEEENLDTMTEFVRRVRQTLNEIGEARGRPYLLAIRVPDSPILALRTGLDVDRWLKEGLMDMLVVGGGYMPYGGRLKEFIDMAHHYGVPAYPCINHFQEPIQMRSWASNFWALGGDGVCVFNFAGVPEGSEKQRCLNQMHDPDALLGLDKQYRPDNGYGTFYCGHTNPARQFPIRLVDGTPAELVVGDDVERAMQEDMLDEMRLRVNVSNVDESEGVVIKINGTSVPTENIEHPEAGYFEALLAAPPLRQGINEITVLPGRGSIGRLSSTVTGLELSVRYK